MRGGTGRLSRRGPATSRSYSAAGRPRATRWAGAFVLGGLVLALGLAGCSAGGGKSASSNNAPAAGVAQPGKADEGQAAGGKDTAAVPGPGQVLKPEEVPLAAQRDIIYTGEITVEVSSVDTAANRLVVLATGAGGYISGDQRSIDTGKSSATIAVRIPADKFQSTLAAIGELGKEAHRQLTAQDVTAQSVDLDSRIKTQQASVDRIRALLAKAQSIAEITSVESELTRREADLESLQAQLAALSDQAALSTITVTLLEPAAVPPAPAKHHKGFVAGLSAGWHAFVASVSVLLTVLGALLPFLVVIGVPVGAVLWFLRRRARLRPASTPAYAMALPAAPPAAPPYAPPAATRAAPPAAPPPESAPPPGERGPDSTAER